MRIGSSIIFFNGVAYQSYNWKRFRPLGALNNVLCFLDEYEVDEISITRPIRDNDNFDSFKSDIEVIKNSFSNSPISFGGGIRNINHLECLNGLPIERFHFSNAFIHMNKKLVEKVINMFGGQAVVASLPIKITDNIPYIFDGVSRKFIKLEKKVLDFIYHYADEIVVVDVENEGLNNSFNFNLLEQIQIPYAKSIITGGVGPKCIKKAKKMQLASCLVDNKVLHKENYMKKEL